MHLPVHVQHVYLDALISILSEGVQGMHQGECLDGMQV